MSRDYQGIIPHHRVLLFPIVVRTCLRRRAKSPPHLVAACLWPTSGPGRSGSPANADVSNPYRHLYNRPTHVCTSVSAFMISFVPSGSVSVSFGAVPPRDWSLLG